MPPPGGERAGEVGKQAASIVEACQSVSECLLAVLSEGEAGPDRQRKQGCKREGKRKRVHSCEMVVAKDGKRDNATYGWRDQQALVLQTDWRWWRGRYPGRLRDEQ